MATTAQRMLFSIRELAPAITARAAGIEASREVPDDLLDALRSIGIFRIFVPQSHGGLEVRNSEIFQGELGRISADIRAARAFFEGQAASLWRHALAGTLKDSGLATQATQTAIWLATTCLRATDACFALGGSSALYENSPLQRRLRDLRTAAQHGVVQQRHYVTAGKCLLDSSAAAPKISA